MSSRTLAALAVLLLGLGGATGCAASGGTTQPAATPRPFNGVIYYDQGERSALHAAEEQRVAECMRRRGFAYAPEPLAQGDHRPDASPYGLLTTAQAANDGFGVLSAALNAQPLPDHNAAADGDASWRQALLGTDSHRVTVNLPAGQQFFYNSDSCVSDAESSLYGPDYYRLFNTFQVLDNEVIGKVQADPRYLTALSRWQACMKAAGENAATLTDPPTSIDQGIQQAAADSTRLHQLAGRELTLARTDADCQQQIGLAHVVALAQTDAETSTLGGYAAELTTLWKLRNAALDVATHDS